MRASVFIATTTDGFIARKDGDLDWLIAADQGDEDYGFEDFMASVDALVMGRNTFEFTLTAGGWAYGETPVFVLTSRRLELPRGFPGRVEPLAMSPEAVAGELDGRGIEHVYVDGGKTIQSFLCAGLVSRMIITRLPLLIGSGIPLFGNLDTDVDLRLVRSTAYENGWVQLEYEVV
jgi:dihydrofolate reductase